ncbi:hypothetical protein LWI29_020097 [Acer saccharum]|uniref:DUF8003 domain-containing protein n=1 Tax=Acer saccharum TaxID=4024 RepID=A0AA39VJ43_ACESA|nr:hypothetical protein LWI29_020097 [Acer saccharum]
MHPLVRHGYLCWCILLGHLYISAFSFSSGQHVSEGIGPEFWLHDSESDLHDDFKSGTTTYAETSTLASPLNNSVSCEDLEGVGSFNTTCFLNSNLYRSSDLYVYGMGNLEILPHVSILCPIEGCMVTFNLSGSVNVGKYASIAAGSVVVSAANLSMEHYASINTTSLGGLPPPQTSGTPDYDGAGGGHGGRGASCRKTIRQVIGVVMFMPGQLCRSHGVMGVRVVAHLLPKGGDGDGGLLRRGGGSGGSIFIRAVKLKGYGTISAAGGSGWGGGGGGRISLNCYSIQEDVIISVHGGFSIGCPVNAGAAGTYFNAYLLSLRVGNDNVTTETETPLLDFPTRPLWSNVFVENNAKVLVPLLWTRVQVRGQISLYRGGSIVFGLSAYPVSEFELVAEELLMSDSIIKVYGAFRVAVKMLLMWNSKIQIDGGGNTVVTTSVLEVRNLVVLTENSVISSNTNLAIYGQGLLKLSGRGNAIKSQRLSLSLFYNITVGPGSVLQAPLDDDASRSVVTKSLCESPTCPIDLITPPDDCHVNYTLSFSLQICRVEDVLVRGLIKGSIIHIHRAKTIIVDADGFITASELGCSNGIGKGIYSNGAGSGAGHGGRGGSGFFNGRLSSGGHKYGNADLPCELGSGTEGPNQSYGHVIGGGMIVMGSIQWPLLRLDIYGALNADGQSVGKATINVATLSGSINGSGGAGDNGGLFGEVGTVTGKKCPKGLYGTFCLECPIGTYKDVDGSDESLCTPCSFEQLPKRANFIYVRGGVSQQFCPYKCISDKYRMPNCYTPLEELTYTFGGPWPFALILSCILSPPVSIFSFPIRGAGTRAEETQSHVYRMYFMGPNTFREPWHLPYSPPTAIIEIVYEDAFNRFIDDVNSVAAYDWWEGSVHSILTVLAYPCAWSWKQWRRRKKIHRLQEYVKSEYDHSCLRSCRSRALYKGMKVGATPDLMVAYIDFFLGGDEKRLDMVSIIQNRFPMCTIFGGDGSYMSPYYLHSDALLTNLLGQHVPATVWNRLVAGLNAQLRTVRHGSIRTALVPVIDWISSHGNPNLSSMDCDEYPRKVAVSSGNSHNQPQQSRLYPSYALSRKKITGGIHGGVINNATLSSLDFKRDFLFPFSLLLHNTRPVGHQGTLQLLITVMLLSDLFITLLLLIEFYWISLGAFLAVLLILPLSLLSPFPAGLNALFSKEPRRASLTRIYALWNAISLSNIVVAFISGIIHYGFLYLKPANGASTWYARRDDDNWWLLPTILLLFKSIQARFVDWHIANLEIQDFSLFSPDPDTFWSHEPS